MDLPAYVARLDEWAEAIREKTAQNWRVYHRKPAEFDFNRNVFRALYMCYCLTTDHGIRYNPAQLGRDVWDFSNADDQFICGLLGPNRSGTCASLPVLAVAIGRRLGYPLHLVMAPNHLLLRWDDGKDPFNVEWNGDGARVHEDDYYYTWPLRWTERAHRLNRTHGVFLSNLSPARELAKCLYNRSVVLRETGRVEEGLEALDAAERLDPSDGGAYHAERVDAFAKLPGIDGLPWMQVTRRGSNRRGRPNVVVTPLFALARAYPDCFWPIEGIGYFWQLRPGLSEPFTCAHLQTWMFGAYWDFIKDQPRLPLVEPGREVLDVADPFRDRSGDPRRATVHIGRKWHDGEQRPHLHVLRIRQSKPTMRRKERGPWSVLPMR